MTYIDVLFDSSSDDVDTDSPNFSLLPAVHNVIGASVVWANIPTTWTVVDRANGFFLIQTDSMVEPVSVLMNTGSYTRQTIGLEILRIIQGIPGLAQPVKDAFQVTINLTTNKLAISNDVEGFRFAFYSTSVSLADMLGFVSKTTGPGNQFDIFDWKVSVFGSYEIQVGQFSPPTNYLLSEKAIELSGPPVISIRTPTIRKTLRGHEDSISTLVSFPNQSLLGGSSYYQNSSPAPVQMSPQSITQMQLYLTLGKRDSYWNEVKQERTKYLSLNRSGWQVVIRFWLESHLKD